MNSHDTNDDVIQTDKFSKKFSVCWSYSLYCVRWWSCGDGDWLKMKIKREKIDENSRMMILDLSRNQCDATTFRNSGLCWLCCWRGCWLNFKRMCQLNVTGKMMMMMMMLMGMIYAVEFVVILFFNKI